MDADSAFIPEHSHFNGTEFPHFILIGASSDGTHFECDNLILTSLKLKTDFALNGRDTIAPEVGYSKAAFKMEAEPVAMPMVRWYLRGFE